MYTPVVTNHYYTAGTIGREISDTIDTLISSVTSVNVGSKKNIFSTLDHTNGVYVRNTDCWAYNVDLTPMSVWNTTGIGYRNGTLISPRHIAFASHYRPSIGDTLRFVTLDNVTVTRTLTSVGTLIDMYNGDIRIGLLDSDVPSTITYAKVLPKAETMLNYITEEALTRFRVPMFYSDGQKKALVGETPWVEKPMGGHLDIRMVSPKATNVTRLLLYEPIVGGDSGNFVGFILNNTLILRTLWYYSTGVYAGGLSYSNYIDDINTSMTTLGGGYQLTEVALSAYPIVEYNTKINNARLCNCTLPN